jgi:putative cardiolipin synthase
MAWLVFWIVLLLVALAVLALVVRQPLPVHIDMPPGARLTGENTSLARWLAPETSRYPGLSGIYALPNGRDAFVARTALADTAESAIDAQYYIWHNDTTGRLLLQALRRAADRGVRVRLLLDDNNTTGMDATLIALDAHPQIEVRLFNPLMHRRLRALDYLSDFFRTNRRMHNKSFTVDGHATVVGGRNVGDEYFGAGDGVAFADLDVLAVGTVVEAVARDFDRYWVSGSTYPLRSVVTDPTPEADPGAQAANDKLTEAYLRALAQSGLVRQLSTGRLPLTWSAVRLVSDDPSKGLGHAGPAQTLLGQLNHELDRATQRLTIVSPYFVPTKAGTEALTALAQRGVMVTVLTNALSATDVAAVHAGYAKYRKDLLRAGVRLFELKRNATVSAIGHGGVTGSSGASLHAKTFEVDGRTLFVGSFNMDPRSAALNTEMGLLIASPQMADRLTQTLATNGPASTYAVELVQDQLRWTTQEDGKTVVFEQEPGVSWPRRAAVRILSWLPIEWML